MSDEFGFALGEAREKRHCYYKDVTVKNEGKSFAVVEGFVVKIGAKEFYVTAIFAKSPDDLVVKGSDVKVLFFFQLIFGFAREVSNLWKSQLNGSRLRVQVTLRRNRMLSK